MKSTHKYIIIVALVLSLTGCTIKHNNVSVESTSYSTVQIDHVTESSSTPDSTYTENTDSATDNTMQTNTTEPIDTAVPAIGINDFDINYNGFIINDTLPFRDVADNLGIEIGKVISSTDIPRGSQIGDWYIVHYPSKDKEDMQIEYVINEKARTQYLVYVKLFSVSTYRGISVGDGINELLLAYGDSIKPISASSTEDVYFYKLDSKSESRAPDKTIHICADKNTKKITRISIDYNSNKAIEELDLHP